MTVTRTLFLYPLFLTLGFLVPASVVRAADADTDLLLMGWDMGFFDPLPGDENEEIPSDDPNFVEFLQEVRSPSPVASPPLLIPLPTEDSTSEYSDRKRKSEESPVSSEGAKRKQSFYPDQIDNESREAKKEKRRQKNCVFASESRKRKKQYIEKLEQELAASNAAYTALQEENQALKKQVHRMLLQANPGK